VTLRVRGVAAVAVTAKLNHLPLVKRLSLVEDKNGAVTVRVFPKANAANGELAREIGEATRGWPIEQLQTEEGRLDEVFRSITMPETAKEKSQ
jgi:ABC-2 type transport system ATP-binding protein